MARQVASLDVRDLRTSVQHIAGGKHFTPEDHPAVLARAIEDLVAEVAARS
jgi:pimeloyl-ACP methyl ester carboxylesterase